MSELFPRQLNLVPGPPGTSRSIGAGEWCLSWEELGECFAPILGGRRIGSVESVLRLRDLMSRSRSVDFHQARAALAAVNELRLAGLVEVPSESFSPETREILSLAGAFESALRGDDLVDETRALTCIPGQLARGEVPGVLRWVECIRVCSGAQLPAAYLDILNAWSTAQIQVVVPWDVERPQAFAWSEVSLHRIEGLGAGHLEVIQDSLVGDGPLAPVRASVLSDRHAQGPVRVWEFSTRPEQTRRLVALVQRWMSSGCPASEMALIVPDDDRELRISVARSLKRQGIPVECPTGPTLATSGVGRLLVGALDLPLQHFPREALIDVVTAAGGIPACALPPSRIAHILREAGVRSTDLGGYTGPIERWANRQRRNRKDCIRDGQLLLRALGHWMEQLAKLPAKARPHQWATFLEGVVKGFLSIGARATSWEARGDREIGLHAVLDGLAEWEEPEKSGLPLGPEEVRGLVEWMVGDLNLPGSTGPGVWVGGFSDVVGRRFKKAILAGIDGGALPRRMAPESGLSELIRSELNRQVGPRLFQWGPSTGKAALDSGGRDRWLWMEGLAAATDEVVVTFVMTQGEQTDGVSELVEDLLRCTGSEVSCEPPSYASVPASPGDALAVWAFGSLYRGARVSERAPVAQEEIEAELAARLPQRRDWVAARVKGARQVASARRAQGDLAAESLERFHHWADARVHSPSQLDQLGSCRFRYFSGVVLGLRREEEPLLGAEPREEGSIAHAALELVYRDLTHCGGLGWARENREECWKRAREVFDQGRAVILAEAEIHDWLVEAAMEGAWGAVVAQLEVDLAATDGFEPWAMEYRFGDRDGAERPPLEIPTGSGTGPATLKVRGSIDRVDRRDDDVRVWDYKRTIRRRTPHRHFQLPLYALATGSTEKPGTMHAGWSELRTGRREYWEWEEGPSASVLPELNEVVAQRWQAIVDGDVAPDPDSADACKYCDFRGLCRLDSVDPLEVAEHG